MLGDVRAELSKAARRPANWLLLAVAVLLSMTFAYLIPYLGYIGQTEGAPSSGRGLAAMLPEASVGSAIAGTPVFVGALSVIFGVLVVGGEYASETWKTVLSQGSPRLRVYAAKLATVLVGTLTLVATLVGSAVAAALLVAQVEGQPVTWPAPVDAVAGFAAAWLVTVMWASLGMALAVAFRSVALPIGLGLVWLLAVQNLISAVAAPLVDWIAEGEKYLPGPNAGSLVASQGAFPGTPGVTDLVAGDQAAVAVAVYAVAFCVIGGWLLSRRDIT